jgi:hypothetical protein
VILYKPDTISQDQIGGVLQGFGYHRQTGTRTMMRLTIEPLGGVSDMLLDSPVRSGMEPVL